MLSLVSEGRKEFADGAHCLEGNMNRRALGVCVVGNFDKAPPDQELLDELVKLNKDIMTRHPITEIDPHTKHAKYKTCPGLLFPMDWVRTESFRQPAPTLTKFELDCMVLGSKGLMNTPAYWIGNTEYNPDYVRKLIASMADYINKH